MTIEFRGEKKKPTKIGTLQTVDMETGESTGVQRNTFTMMPCAPDKCQECAVDHAHDQPHNQQSLYYQYQFYGKHARWPTWSDAMAHCTLDVQAAWKALLIKQMKSHGLPIPDDLSEGPVTR